MPEWVYLLAIFIALTLGYFSGFVAGSWRSDRAPSEHAWINVRRYSIDMNKECAMKEMELNHEESKEMIKRGVFDSVSEKTGYPPEDEEDDSD